MKKKAIGLGILFVLVLALSTSGMAYSPVSFRIRGMGEGLAGIVDDEFTDFNLFPALVTNMSGTTIFTDLSNLDQQNTLNQSGDGTATRYYGDSTNVLGLVTDLGAGKGGFLVESGSYSWSDTEAHTISIEDEAKVAITGKDEWTGKSKFLDASLFYGQELSSGVRVGLRLGSESLEGDSTYTDTKTASGVNDDRSINASTKTTWSHPGEETTFRLEGGAQFNVGESVIDVVGRYSPEERTFKDLYLFSSETNLDFDGFSLDAMLGAHGNNSHPDYSMVVNLDTFALKGRISTPTTLFGQDAVARLSAGFSTGTGDYEQTYVREVIVDGDATVEPEDEEDEGRTYAYDGYEKRQTKYSGDVESTSYDLGGGYQVALGDQTILGLGLRVAGAKDKDVRKSLGFTVDGSEKFTVDGEEVCVEEWEFEDNNPAFEQTTETESFSVSLPVGFEHKLTDRVSLRLGAEAFLVNKSKTTTKAKLAFSEEELETEIALSMSPPKGENVVLECSDVYEGDNSKTVYSAGLGFQLSENIQLDVLHFTNLTNLKKWQVSASIKF